MYMTKIAVQKKLRGLEAEIRMLKIAVRTQPNFSVDEMNWRKIKPELKKARKQVAKRTYG